MEMTDADLLAALFVFYMPWLIYEVMERRDERRRFNEYIAVRRWYSKRRLKAIHKCEM